MIPFRDYLLLLEAPMSDKAFRAAAERMKDAKVGFEFEFALHQHHSLIRSDDENDSRETRTLRELDSPDDYNQFFDIGYRATLKIQNEYESWRNEKAEQWAEKKVKGVDKDDYDQERWDRIQEFLSSDEYSFKDYIYDRYNSLYDFTKVETDGPLYGWANDKSDDSRSFYIDADPNQRSREEREEAAFVKVARSLQKFLGTPVKASEFDHDEHYAKGHWVVMSDGSVLSNEKNENDVGVEVVSPPYDLPRAITALEQMFEWMNVNDVETNKTTGLHINISLPNGKDIDLVKLVLFVGDVYLLKQFGRLTNVYTPSQVHKILDNLDSTGKLPKEADQMIALATAALNNHKYAAINISKLAEKGYLEFRIVGGADYHKKFKQIEAVLLRYITVLEIAANPEAERKLYLKKLTTLFQKVIDGEGNSDFESRPIADILDFGGEEAAARMLNDLMAQSKAGRLKSPSAQERAQDWATETFLRSLFKATTELNILKPSDRQKAEFKLIMKKLYADPSMFTGNVNSWKADILRRFGARK